MIIQTVVKNVETLTDKEMGLENLAEKCIDRK